MKAEPHGNWVLVLGFSPFPKLINATCNAYISYVGPVCDVVNSTRSFCLSCVWTCPLDERDSVHPLLHDSFSFLYVAVVCLHVGAEHRTAVHIYRSSYKRLVLHLSIHKFIFFLAVLDTPGVRLTGLDWTRSVSIFADLDRE